MLLVKKLLDQHPALTAADLHSSSVRRCKWQGSLQRPLLARLLTRLVVSLLCGLWPESVTLSISQRSAALWPTKQLEVLCGL